MLQDPLTNGDDECVNCHHMLNESLGLAHTTILRAQGRAPSLSKEGQQLLTEEGLKVLNPKGFPAHCLQSLGTPYTVARGEGKVNGNGRRMRCYRRPGRVTLHSALSHLSVNTYYTFFTDMDLVMYFLGKH